MRSLARLLAYSSVCIVCLSQIAFGQTINGSSMAYRSSGAASGSDWTLTENGYERALRWSEQHPEQAAATFADAIATREASYRIFFAIAARRTPQPHAVAALNRALDAAPARRVLVRDNKGFGWEIDRVGFSATALLAPVLWSAGDLMVSTDTIRLRHCSNEQCLWLFLDESKNGSRRWCSMQACGNRAKAHRHYLRTRTA